MSSFLHHNFKVGLSPSKKIYSICFNENPLKMMKNAVYFTLKALFVFKIFKLLSGLFSHLERTVWLPLLVKTLGNMCITTACYPGFDVINFEIKLIFLINSFIYMTKKSRQKFKYLENRKSFSGEIKSIFHHF